MAVAIDTMADYLVFFPQTGACRHFDSYNLAQASYPRQPILTGLDDIPVAKALHWYEQLFEYADSAGKHFTHGTTHVTHVQTKDTFPKVRTAEDLEEPQLLTAFWNLALAVADRVTRDHTKGRKGKRPTGYKIDLVKANEALADTSLKIPDQARAIIAWLTNQEFDYYTREEMIRHCHSVIFLKAIKTKQDPWRVWRYYGPLLTKLGVLR